MVVSFLVVILKSMSSSFVLKIQKIIQYTRKTFWPFNWWFLTFFAQNIWAKSLQLILKNVEKDSIRLHCSGGNLLIPLYAYPTIDTSNFPSKINFGSGRFSI